MFAAALFGIENEDQMYLALGCVAIGAAVLLAIIVIGVKAWQAERERQASLHRADLEAELKREMIERGMSAEEITGVLSAQLRETQIYEGRVPERAESSMARS